jgi:hypothetical protein
MGKVDFHHHWVPEVYRKGTIQILYLDLCQIFTLDHSGRRNRWHPGMANPSLVTRTKPRANGSS